MKLAKAIKRLFKLSEKKDPYAQQNQSASNRGCFIECWWERKPLNFGDIITSYIIKQISGADLAYIPEPRGKPNNRSLISTGSILQSAGPGTHVWGSGIMSRMDIIEKNAVFHAVRGPLSRELVMKQGARCPKVFGDPAQLLPLLYKPRIKTTYEIGIIPHYVDYDAVKKQCSDDTLCISPIATDPLHVVNDILRCNKIVSSSLHGIIVSQSYGIPSAWVEFSDFIRGDKSKYYDYFLSTAQGSEMEPHDLRSMDLRFDNLTFLDEYRYSYDALLSSFPYDLVQWKT